MGFPALLVYGVLWLMGAVCLIAEVRNSDLLQQGEVLHSFEGNDVDGSAPMGGLVWGPDGQLYGTTSGATEWSNGPLVHGSVFRLTQDGDFTTLFAFSLTNGSKPSELLLGRDGNFYGTTAAGGRKEEAAGTVFRMSPNGVLTTLYEFSYSDTNGAAPIAGLIQGSDGAFYGTTSEYVPFQGSGAVFRITAEGELTNLFTFAPNVYFENETGGSPRAALIEGTNGLFYGTASTGGTNGYGTLFSINTNGVFTVLHHFTGTNGAAPVAELFRASDGFLYGSTLNGLGDNFRGTLFRISPEEGNLNILAGFGSSAAMVQAQNGKLYGTFDGSIFSVSLLGEVTIEGKLIFNYTGNQSFAPLLEGRDGLLYGTGLQGQHGYGTIFRLSFELPTMSAALIEGEMVLSWPQAMLDQTGEFDHIVQYTTDLAEPRTWSLVGLSSVSSSSKVRRYIYREAASEIQRYYRLIRP